VFLGGIVNYVLASERYFRDYVLNYTNAATLLTEDFADTEDLDGVFSGLDREHRTYDFETWRYPGPEVHDRAPASAPARAPGRSALTLATRRPPGHTGTCRAVWGGEAG
jgi:formate dehydrogenase major subunit